MIWLSGERSLLQAGLGGLPLGALLDPGLGTHAAELRLVEDRKQRLYAPMHVGRIRSGILAADIPWRKPTLQSPRHFGLKRKSLLWQCPGPAFRSQSLTHPMTLGATEVSRRVQGFGQAGLHMMMLPPGRRVDCVPVAVRRDTPRATREVDVGLNQSQSQTVMPGTGPDFPAGLPELPVGPSADEAPPAPDSLFARAERFITLFHSENRAGSPGQRLRRVRREIDAMGTYQHTADELAFGARVAWRNSSKCIGRLYWQSLRVRDRRQISAAPDIAAEAIAHLREATNGGRIRPVITVFAPDAPGIPGPRILNSQLVRYAGYQESDDTITGDPANVDITSLARGLGWPGVRPSSRFDVLPLLVQEAGGLVTMHQLPADAVLQVSISHPEYAWFSSLGLRWYAVPVVSDMYLDIGGVCYPAAPFNGWYMCTEIGSRDLGDVDRYDQLPVIAQRMGLSTASDRTLWKDKAMTELNVAVLHSFGAAGVTISDHHTESVRFLQHIEREERYGRLCPADWTWIVPPAASSATAVFHRYYQDIDQTPNFYRHQASARLVAVRCRNGWSGPLA